LDLVKNLIDDIASRTLANLPEDYADFSKNINTLPEDNTLPLSYRKSDIINLYKDYRQWLVDNEFVKDFRQTGGRALAFASNLDNRDKILDYRKKTTDLFDSVLEITGTEAGQIFNNGWLDSEVDIIGMEGIVASYGGEND